MEEVPVVNYFFKIAYKSSNDILLYQFFNHFFLILKFAMSCPCGLTKEEVIDLDRRDRVHLIGGKCQNPLADGSDGVCGKALGAHPSSQGYKIIT